ncbi:hypothetical protein [Oscillatoria sp. HE19RPO]|nr:hypothetical protein [Oscillatoria sp. HE19RPO]
MELSKWIEMVNAIANLTAFLCQFYKGAKGQGNALSFFRALAQ